jgi:predicted ATPase with chaperone activity
LQERLLKNASRPSGLIVPTLLLRSLTFSGAATRRSPGELVLAHRGVLHLDESAFSSELFNALPTVLKTGELALWTVIGA